MKLNFPNGKRFAFTIIDDTDVATLANVKPVYDLLYDCGLRTTKTVWPFRWDGQGSSFVNSDTLEDEPYLAFIQDLARQGFEIASHGATMESSERPITEAALDRFIDCFGSIPAVYANHSYNAEGVYWGEDRFDDPLLRLLARRMQKNGKGYFQGHVPGSKYWWGDLCLAHHRYVRNLTCTGINTLRYNPSMPYQDPKRPWVQNWFSASDAEDCEAFVQLVTPQNLDLLEAQGGVCIVATHLGKNFTRDGVVDPRVTRALRDLQAREGLYIPVGPLLDWLRSQRGGEQGLPRWEWRAMQWRWAADLLLRKLSRNRGH